MSVEYVCPESFREGIDKSKTIFKKYVHSSSSLRAELVPLLGKLTAFAGILRGLQLECELDESNTGRLQVFAHIQEPLETSKRAAQTIVARLDQVVSVRGISLSFGKILNKETAAALHILDQTKSVLDLALTADQRTLLKSIESYVRNVAEDLNNIREESRIHYQDLKNDLCSIKASEAEETKTKAKAQILDWVSQVNYSSNYHTALLPTRDDDASGDWFINGRQFQDWASKSISRGLILTGISGGGKTVLCSKAIKALTQNNSIKQQNSSIVYFFFDFNDVAKQSDEGMVRSLIFQLTAKLEELPEDLRTLYSKHQNTTSVKSLPRFQDWCDILGSQLSNTNPSYIFVDALDECAETEASLLQETLQTLFKQTDPMARWFLTCRPSHRSVLMSQNISLCHVTMDVGVVDNDIQRYLSTKLQNDHTLASFGPAARELIVSQIKSRSSGMFRFAQCQLNALAKMKDRRVKKVKEVLDTMPMDISSMYSRILHDLQGSDDWPIVDRVLTLVSYSARPVTVAEVAEFAILEDGMATVQPEDRFEDFAEFLSLINTLINIQEGYLTLAHKSVQDFLITLKDHGFVGYAHASDLLYRGADSYIARRCLQYLAFAQQPIWDIAEARTVKDPNSRYLAKLLVEHPFLEYAASRWPHHVRTKELQMEVVDQMKLTLPFTVKPNLWKAWLMLQRIDIWDTQIQLARLLCEALIRSCLVSGWAHNFWQTRQHYRVRTHSGEPSIAIPDHQPTANPAGAPNPIRKFSKFIADCKATLKNAQGSTKAQAAAPVKLDNRDSSRQLLSSEPEANFYVKALYTLEVLSEDELSFRAKDLILVLGKQSTDRWRGTLNGRVGLFPASLVERYYGDPAGEVTGSLFYDLAVALLEIALQTSLFAELK